MLTLLGWLAAAAGVAAALFGARQAGRNAERIEGMRQAVEVEEHLRDVAFSPGGRMLAIVSGETIRLWEVASGKELEVLRSHETQVSSVAFSPDGRTLATGSWGGTARLWAVPSGKEIGVLRGHEGLVSSVAFSPDGRTLATGSWDRTARLWPVGQHLVDLACARVHALPLSDTDKDRFGIDKEWCTREVSGALRAKFGLDKPDAAPPPIAAATASAH